jgi:flagella basal body P-ring formation protein FlgA
MKRSGNASIWGAFALCALPGALMATPWQSPASIRDAAEAFVLEHSGAGDDAQVEAIAVDDRLKLPLCSEKITASADRPLVNGRGTVTVSCAGAQPWRLYVPVRVSELVPVVVMQSSLQRDAVLAAENVSIEMRRSSMLPYQYLSRIEEAVGYRARRSLTSGTVLVPAALEQRRLIARGALVTLVSSARGIEVSAEGVAVEDAGLQQRIRVRTAVGRIVEGIVESPHRVRVGT